MCESSYVHANGMNNQRIKSRLHVEEKPLFCFAFSKKRNNAFGTCLPGERSADERKKKKEGRTVRFFRSQTFSTLELEIYLTNVALSDSGMSDVFELTFGHGVSSSFEIYVFISEEKFPFARMLIYIHSHSGILRRARLTF